MKDEQVLDVGRTHRLVTRKQFRALLRRHDGHCAHPGCLNTKRLHAHHVLPWLIGGRTDMDNLILLCEQHHVALHDGAYRIRKLGKAAAKISFMGVFFPFVTGFAATWLIFNRFMISDQQHKLVASMFIGTALSITALSVLAKILIDLDLIKSRFGNLMMTAAMINRPMMIPRTRVNRITTIRVWNGVSRSNAICHSGSEPFGRGKVLPVSHRLILCTGGLISNQLLATEMIMKTKPRKIGANSAVRPLKAFEAIPAFCASLSFAGVFALNPPTSVTMPEMTPVIVPSTFPISLQSRLPKPPAFNLAKVSPNVRNSKGPNVTSRFTIPHATMTIEIQAPVRDHHS